MRILIVDGTADGGVALSQDILALGFQVSVVGDGSGALAALRSGQGLYQAVLMDMVLPDTDARQLLQAMRQCAPEARIIALVRENALASAREALNWGACDFLTKPCCPLRLSCVLQHVLRYTVKDGAEYGSAQGILPSAFFNGDSTAYHEAKACFGRAVSVGIPVLLEGACSTGKAALAHDFLQTALPFPIHMGFLDARTSLAEELREKLKGLLSAAEAKNAAPCLLIRRIDAASPALQAALMDIIERDVVQAGRLRIVATATGRLMDAVKSKNFLCSLYTRLHAAPLWLSPLKERPHDIKLLGQYFLQEANELFGTRFAALAPHVLKEFCNCAFTQNIASLKRRIFKLVLRQSGQSALMLDFQEEPEVAPPVEPLSQSFGYEAYATDSLYGLIPLLNKEGGLRPLKELEADALCFARRYCHGHMARMARELEIGRTTLYRRLLKNKHDKREPSNLVQDERRFKRAQAA